jgi:HK97 family phage prohead protease
MADFVRAAEDMDVPLLTGPERVHNGALERAIDAISELMSQEAAENEPGELAPLIAAREYLLGWVRQESNEYGGGGDQPAPDYALTRATGWIPAQRRGRVRTPATIKSGMGGNLVRKSFSAETKAVDGAKGRVEALVNVGSVLDYQDDVMEPGCWADVLSQMKAGDMDWPSICWGHDWSVIVGKVLDAEEMRPGDSRLPQKILKAGGGALRITGQYNLDTQRGREAFSDVAGGFVKQWSVGFESAKGGQRYEKGIRYVSKVGRWPEVSNVLLGASPGTHTATTKSGPVVGSGLTPSTRAAMLLYIAKSPAAASAIDESGEWGCGTTHEVGTWWCGRCGGMRRPRPADIPQVSRQRPVGSRAQVRRI